MKNHHPATADEPELFSQEKILPASITVPGHLSEHYLQSVLNLTAQQIHALMGDVLGCPRDYLYNRKSGVHLFTFKGVKRLVEHFKLPVDVVEYQTTATAMTKELWRPGASISRKDATPRWMRRDQS